MGFVAWTVALCGGPSEATASPGIKVLHRSDGPGGADEEPEREAVTSPPAALVGHGFSESQPHIVASFRPCLLLKSIWRQVDDNFERVITMITSHRVGGSADPVDGLETGWTDQHVRGPGRLMRTKTTTLPR